MRTDKPLSESSAPSLLAQIPGWSAEAESTPAQIDDASPEREHAAERARLEAVQTIDGGDALAGRSENAAANVTPRSLLSQVPADTAADSRYDTIYKDWQRERIEDYEIEDYARQVAEERERQVVEAWLHQLHEERRTLQPEQWASLLERLRGDERNILGRLRVDEAGRRFVEEWERSARERKQLEERARREADPGTCSLRLIKVALPPRTATSHDPEPTREDSTECFDPDNFASQSEFNKTVKEHHRRALESWRAASTRVANGLACFDDCFWADWKYFDGAGLFTQGEVDSILRHERVGDVARSLGLSDADAERVVSDAEAAAVELRDVVRSLELSDAADYPVQFRHLVRSLGLSDTAGFSANVADYLMVEASRHGLGHVNYVVESLGLSNADAERVVAAAKRAIIDIEREEPTALPNDRDVSRCIGCGRPNSFVRSTQFARDGIYGHALCGCSDVDIGKRLAKLATWCEAVDARNEVEAERKRMEGQVSLSRLFDGDRAPLPWVVDKLISDDALTLLVGESGDGKTFLAMLVAICVATGIGLLGHAVTRGRVLLVLLEGSERDWSRRIEQLARGLCTTYKTLEGELDVYHDRLQTDDPESYARLAQYAKTRGYKLIVVDNLTEIRQGSAQNAENSSDAMGNAMRPLAQLAHDEHLAVLLLHHAGASGSLRGSTAIRQMCDEELRISKGSDRNDAPITLTRGKSRRGDGAEKIRYRLVDTNDRRGERVSIAAELVGDREGGRDQDAMSVDCAIAEGDLTPRRKAILEMVAATPGVGINAIVRKIGGSKRDVAAELEWLAKDGQLRVDASKKYWLVDDEE